MFKVNEDNIVITRTYSFSKMGQPSETATGPSDDSVSSVSTRHHHSESEEVHSSEKPLEKIAPATINTVRNKPAGKEIAPGLKMSSMGKKIVPEELNLLGRRLPLWIQFQLSILIIRRQKSPARLALFGERLSLYMKPDLLKSPGKILI